VVPFLRGYWQQSHYGDPIWQFIPEDSATVRTMLFQLRTNGPPGFLRPYMTDDGRYANISFIYPDHKGDTIMKTVLAADAFIEEHPMGEVIVRLHMDQAEKSAPLWNWERLKDIWYYMLGPVLPARHHTLQVLLRKDNASSEASQAYRAVEVQTADGTPMPPWLGEFREKAHLDYENAESEVEEGDVFTWPKDLKDWDEGDVDYWWESPEHGIRAVAVDTTNLIVLRPEGRRRRAALPADEVLTRGAQFVMAGGVMGILAAINDEVERAHVREHRADLRRDPRAPLDHVQLDPERVHHPHQIATATMLSLAYMAIGASGSTSTRSRSSRWASASGSTTRSTSSTASDRRWRIRPTSTKRSDARSGPRGWR